MINKFIPIKENYRDMSELEPNSILYFIKKSLTLNKSFKILDYGCGYGGVIKYLNTLSSNFTYYSIDIDKDAENYCHNLYPNRLLKCKTYDLILLIGVVELNNDKENNSILNYIKRHSNSETIIVITTDLFSFKNLRTLYYYFISLGKISQYYKLKKYYKNNMSNLELRRKLIKNGFEIIKIFPGPLFYPQSRIKKFTTWLAHLNSSYGYIIKIK